MRSSRRKRSVTGILQNKNRRKKKNKNQEIMHVTVLFTALFLVLMGYILYYTAAHEEELINNSYNPRQQLLAEQNIRGSIYARDGELLAESVKGEDGGYTRSYPYGSLFSHAVGYSTNGKTGIEAQCNYDLIHSDLPFAVKAENERKNRKNPGNNVTTTLDATLQQTAYDALGAYKGAVVAMDPTTGEILAMVSKPDYDPNLIVEQWDELIADKESGTLLNRVSQGLYPPGSTFKIVTALEYMRENPDTYESFSFDCGGSFTHGEDKIKCYHGTKHGLVDLEKAFAKSCNASFASIGLKLDKEQFSKTLNGLYFNSELPVEFAYHKSSILIGDDTTDSEMMQNAIGQGRTQETPLHMAMITAAVANGGVMMKPYLVDGVKSADGVALKEYKPSAMGKEVMTAGEAAFLTDLMTGVVESGTATKLSGRPYTAAGKTGSAEYSGVKEESHAWFTGFAPVENPRLVVTVIIEGAGSGGDVAVPVARRVFDGYLDR